MTEQIQFERPNTVSGLIAKHKELMALRQRYRDEIKRVTMGLYHLDAAIKLFDPKAALYEIKEHVEGGRARRGEVKRFVLDTLRTSDQPLTSRDLTELWCEERGLELDEFTLTNLRKRIGACLQNCERQGLTEGAGSVEKGPTGPLKLWRIRSTDG